MSMLNNPLLHIGLGMLSQSGPSQYPQGMAGIGRGAMMGMQNYQQQQQMNMMNQQYGMLNKYRQAQTSALETETELNNKMLEQAARLAENEKDPNMRLLAQVAPQKYLELTLGVGDTSLMKNINFATDPNVPPQQRALAESYLQGSQTPYYNYMPTTSGIVQLDARGREPARIVEIEGETLTRPQDDPELQGAISESEAAGEVVGETTATRALGAKERIKGYNNILENFEWLKRNKGSFNNYYGWIQGRIPTVRQGTTDAKAKIDQIVAFTSIENREKLKGSGTISDFEALTLEKAGTILSQTGISEDVAWKEIEKVEGIIKQAIDREEEYKDTPQEEGVKRRRFNPTTGQLE